MMRRNRTIGVHPPFTTRPWRVEFEQSSLPNGWVYKFDITDTSGLWVELPGRVRSAYRTVGRVVQLIAELHGLSGKLWRALLIQLQHTRPLPIDGVFEGVIFSSSGRLSVRSKWMSDEQALRLASLSEPDLRAAFIETARGTRTSCRVAP